MTQYIEPMPISHIETLFEMTLRLLHYMKDTGGCTGWFPGVSPWDEDDLGWTCDGFLPGITSKYNNIKHLEP